jgi:hypothetical protein
MDHCIPVYYPDNHRFERSQQQDLGQGMTEDGEHKIKAFSQAPSAQNCVQ